MVDILWILAAYLLGSVPFGLVFARCVHGIDPREIGSGNIGATNVARLCGFGWGVCTLACDLGKGLAAAGIALYINPNAIFVTLASFAAVAGHRWSCFMGFQGGKAVATSIGVFLPLAFWQTFVALILCVGCILRSGFVSVGSLAFIASLPFFLLLTGVWRFIPLALAVAVVIIKAHEANILRLLSGGEKSWKKDKS
ncbi:MAG: glycerol-3-phosphate 1-O-acyltransferase PlsY [Deltaproteobacteria bacterium]|jgi:glycerol-3-phosphate acyltransferase PlsY|nr:glycerol-3-phosphate 1-O-acyltransferase PlsY [Deltaproteobacteria bacterium]